MVRELNVCEICLKETKSKQAEFGEKYIIKELYPLVYELRN